MTSHKDTSERQYRITRKKADQFREALKNFASNQTNRSDIHPRLIQAEREGMESQLSDLVVELTEYERLKSKSSSVLSVSSFDELGDGLIRARIACGLSQKDLARRMGLKEQQVQHYEATHYASASYDRLREVANALELRIRNDIFLPAEPRCKR